MKGPGTVFKTSQILKKKDKKKGTRARDAPTEQQELRLMPRLTGQSLTRSTTWAVLVRCVFVKTHSTCLYSGGGR